MVADPVAGLPAVLHQLSQVLVGKERQVSLAVACLLARGHLLLEDLPGTGKTTLAEALARSHGLAFRRQSFTSDLLPGDLIGINVLDPSSGSFRFRPGPLFAQVLLADEINRASPRTQSALLEAMASGAVSVDGVSHALPAPFFVIATQNGLDQSGTALLPESQLDRFLMRLSLGFPHREAEARLLAGEALPLADLLPLLNPATLLALQQRSAAQPVSPALIGYVLDLLAWTRRSDTPGAPLSPRAGLALLAASRAWSLLQGDGWVRPEHVQAVLPAVVEHRLDAGQGLAAGSGISRQLLQEVDAVR
jgi:MoxR-like ATPase